MLLKTFHKRIKEKAQDNSTPPVLIVAFGASVTQGCMEEGRMDFDAVYHNKLKQLLEKRYPETTFSVINAGYGGESIPGALGRLDRDVIQHKPDLVIVDYGLNDACSRGLKALSAFSSELTSLIQRTQSATSADIVLLTPNRMATRDNELVASRWKSSINLFIDTQLDGTADAYAEAIRRVASECGVAFADVYAAWSDLEDAGVDTTLQLCNGINHPNVDMQEMAAQVIMKEIVKNEK